jgi:hypothetical protein
VIWNRDPWEVPRLSGGEPGVSIFAIDPGGTTGWAWGMFRLDWIQSSVAGAIGLAAAAGWIKHGMVATWPRWAKAASGLEPSSSSFDTSVGSYLHREEKVVGKVMSLIRGADEFTFKKSVDPYGALPINGITWVICEDFILNERSADRSLLSPVRLVSGLYNALVHEDDVNTDFLLQSRSDKATIRDEQLKEMELWWPGAGHDRDAARHMVFALQRFRASQRR